MAAWFSGSFMFDETTLGIRNSSTGATRYLGANALLGVEHTDTKDGTITVIISCVDVNGPGNSSVAQYNVPMDTITGLWLAACVMALIGSQSTPFTDPERDFNWYSMKNFQTLLRNCGGPELVERVFRDESIKEPRLSAFRYLATTPRYKVDREVFAAIYAAFYADEQPMVPLPVSPRQPEE